MKILNDNHLTYCFNIFNEDQSNPLSENFISSITKIRDRILKEKTQPFGIGLWLNKQNLDFFDSYLTRVNFKNILTENNFYTPTINAFPYGTFHNCRVKENVYIPDWRSDERLNYTIAVADFLAEIMPDDTYGSISTVPGGYEKFISKQDFANIAGNLFKINSHLWRIKKETGKTIKLAVEFEPDCIWESASEFIEFKNKYLNALDSIENFIAICYDCSHAETINANLQNDIDDLQRNNIQIAKFQLSSALGAKLPESKIELAKFADPVYLHQSSVINDSKIIARFSDLDELLQADEIKGELISHYHLPIFFEHNQEKTIFAKKNTLLDLLKLISTGKIRSTHLEIETYTYSVLPEDLRGGKLTDFIEKEYSWFLDNLKNPLANQ